MADNHVSEHELPPKALEEPRIPPASPEHELEAGRMPLWEHLDELRTMLFRCIGAIALGFCFTYYYSDVLVLFLEQPLLRFLPEDARHLYFTGIADKFVIYVEVSLLAAVGLVSPFLFYQLWAFVSPALYRNEKRFAVPFVIAGSCTFLMGLAFAYYLVIPYGYDFLVNFGNPTDRPIITLTEYFSLTLKLLIAIGLVFEVPILLVLLAKFGIVDAPFLTKNRRYAFLICTVVAAVATPSPDAFSMVLVLVPLYLLFEASIIAVGIVNKQEKS